MAALETGRPNRVRRFFASVEAWCKALDYSTFDYTLERISGLEKEIAQLKDEARQREALFNDANRTSEPSPVTSSSRFSLSKPPS